MANLRVSPAPRSTRWGLPAAFLSLVALLVLSTPARGTTAGTRDDDPERTQLEETRQQRQEVALELDLLQRSDTELEARLAELGAGITAGEDLLVQRRQAVEAADARVAELDARVEESAARLARQESVFQARVVSAYIRAGTADVEVLLGSDDYNEFHERVVLMRQVAGHDRSVLSDLVAARDELDGDRRAAAAARREASRLATEAEEALAELASQQAEQEAVRDALQARIVAFQAEVDALEADEADLVALIESRAAATTTTLPVTSTTGPAPTSSTSVPTSGATLVPTSSAPTTTPSTTSTVVTAPPTTRPGAPAFQWPVAGTVTSPFGPRWGRMHEGIDIGADTGTPIRAAAGGTVILADWFGGYGNTVLVDHGGGYVTLYAHQSSLSVSEGDTVSAGQTVGLVGSTGHSTGPHLHFEVRVGGVAEDPELYLP